MKNKPKHDGSGRGTGANKGRGGCLKLKSTRQGRRRIRWVSGEIILRWVILFKC